jgi:hypothetical protein
MENSPRVDEWLSKFAELLHLLIPGIREIWAAIQRGTLPFEFFATLLCDENSDDVLRIDDRDSHISAERRPPFIVL